MADQQVLLDALAADLLTAKTTLDQQNILIGNLDVAIQALQAQVAGGTGTPLDFTAVNSALSALQGTITTTESAVALDTKDAAPVVKPTPPVTAPPVTPPVVPPVVPPVEPITDPAKPVDPLAGLPGSAPLPS